MAKETIAAIATPPGLGGIGVVRVSGPLAAEIAKSVLGQLPAPRYAFFGSFLDADGTAIDEGIALFYPGPHSFTGENVIELQGHGGPWVMDQLLGRCLSLGARNARPGEFTERAFLNGKLDLAQAEAVADLIESATALGAKLSIRSLQGALSRRVNALAEELTRVRIQLEATLDFPDEEIDVDDRRRIVDGVSTLIERFESFLAAARQGERIRDGLNVVIAGPPNAGKSSLLNLLSQSDAAIVTPIPGTTRDPLRVDVQVDGLPLRLTDTAGLRDSDDHVEREGVRRARDRIDSADLILWVYDCAEGYDPVELSGLPEDCAVTLIKNKIDLGSCRTVDNPRGLEEIALSVVTGQGLASLRAHLRKRAGIADLGEGAFVARRRHLDALQRALASVYSAARAIEEGLGSELVAWDLHSAQQAIGEITGEVTSDDLLGRIFSSFCIGK